MYRKIRNVPLHVCTAEQKIAYNLALALPEIFRSEYRRMPCQFQKSDVVMAAVAMCLDSWKKSYSYSEKYDIDMIHCALNAGMENFLNLKCPILWSYQEIGEVFPAYYL